LWGNVSPIDLDMRPSIRSDGHATIGATRPDTHGGLRPLSHGILNLELEPRVGLMPPRAASVPPNIAVPVGQFRCARESFRSDLPAPAWPKPDLLITGSAAAGPLVMRQDQLIPMPGPHR